MIKISLAYSNRSAGVVFINNNFLNTATIKGDKRNYLQNPL
jgi:hypothetical protein